MRAVLPIFALILNWLSLVSSTESTPTPYRLFRERYRPKRQQQKGTASDDAGVSLDQVLSAKKTAQKNCRLVEVNFNFDSYPEDISWMITLGDKDDVQSGTAIVIAQSHLQYDEYIDKERHSLCLPTRGQYTYTIFDWSGNGMKYGSYSLVLEGREILRGGDFYWMKRHEFRLPLPEDPSLSPSQSRMPSASPAPSFDCTFIDISITYDMKPEETSWLVVTGDYDDISVGNFEVVAQSPPDSVAVASDTEVHRVCLPASLGEVFSFVIKDSAFDGLHGEGGYMITSPDLPDGEIVGQGGQFSTFDVSTFRIPFQIAPSSSPSMSPQPTKSPYPTIDCVPIEVRILFDLFPNEITWHVTAVDTNEILFESPDYCDETNVGLYVEEILCLPLNGVFSFEILDWSGDGLCCESGEGYYAVVATGDSVDHLIAEGSTFQSSDITTFDIVGGEIVLSGVESTNCTKGHRVEIGLVFIHLLPDTKWVIVEGGSLDDDATVLVESPTYSLDDVNSVRSQTVCIEEGQYTFAIYDDGGALESYSLAFRDGGKREIISEGGAPDGIESTTFSIPYIPPTTTDPCTNATLSILFDSYPYELSWMICTGELECTENANLLAKSPYYNVAYRNTEESRTICLPREQQFTFLILDTVGDGLCCSYGYGRYILTLQKDDGGKSILAQGSDFSFKESVTFSIPSKQSDHSLQSSSPALIPSMTRPNPMLPMTAEHDCTPINITLHFDLFPHELSWWLIAGHLNELENNEHELIASSPDYGDVDRFSTLTHEACLPSAGSLFSFIIFDEASNGMSSENFGNGGYFLSHESKVFAKGGRFGFIDIRSFETPFPLNCDFSTLQVDILSDELGLWELTMGGLGSMESNLAIIMAQSQNAGKKTAYVCLADGQYTFSVFDGASYQLIMNGRIIVDGSTSSTFTITSELPELSVPSAANSLVPSPGPSFGTTIQGSSEECISVNIAFDDFPDEVRWVVLSGDYDSFDHGGDYSVIAEHSYYDSLLSTNSSKTVSHIVCLPEEGQYTFIIWDWDGLCCRHGNGGYEISSVNTPSLIIGKGGEFTELDVITFSKPLAFAPNASRTPSPTPTCVQLVIVMNFDANPGDTRWEIHLGERDPFDMSGLGDAGVVASSPFYDEEYAFGTVRQAICLPGRHIYTFSIMDGWGNGMCCDQGTGGYMLLLEYGDGYEVIVEGDGVFEWSESQTFDLTRLIVEDVAPRIDSGQHGSIRKV